MSTMRLKRAVLFLTAVSMAAQVHAVGIINKIEASPANPVLEGGKALVKFTVTGSAEDSDSCGLWIDYGDGSNPDTRIVNKSEGLFPRVFEHTFTKPGGYSVKAKGQRVKQTFGCGGDANTLVTVMPQAGVKKGAESTRPAAAAPVCPDGWQLVANSVRQRTGEFSCSPKAPAAKINCGPGLAYYEKGGTIGCRKP